ncbi:hypothetical protein HSBAA_03580 [Vreelandella sulfidaeris]|uniref:Uncharacterized protein n=1 Tax=Vreelandella sulfidaeris TaxID=115553 RepID=A0A455TZV1_9GAMM|nr:hypothetical protein HSBAA_03580 [Halomonas sulfidaeris]
MGGQREDAAMASFFIISLAAGVMLISLGGSSVDLTHVLFGSILAINSTALLLIAGISTLIVVTLAIVFRALVVECLDPLFLRGQSRRSGWVHSVFFGAVSAEFNRRLSNPGYADGSGVNDAARHLGTLLE